MKITRIRAHNLRQLRDVDITIPDKLSLVVGPNDTGKTTLLCIASRWALWGAHAVPSQNRQVTYGESDMEVDAYFLLNGLHYHVKRRLHLTDSGRPTVTLHFEHLGESLTQGTIRETQASIDSLIGTYETFRMTAYVDQVEGPGDFLKRTPADQREVLRELLALGEWDAWHEDAKKNAAALGQTVNMDESRLEAMRSDIENIPAARKNLATAEVSVTNAETALRVSEAAKTKADRAVEELFNQHLVFEQSNRSIEQVDSRLGILNDAMGKARNLVAADNSLIEAGDEIKRAWEDQEEEQRLWKVESAQLKQTNNRIATGNEQRRTEYSGRAKAVADEISRIQKEQSDRAAARKAAAKCPSCGQPIDVPDALEPVTPEPATLPVIQDLLLISPQPEIVADIITLHDQWLRVGERSEEHAEDLRKVVSEIEEATADRQILEAERPEDTDPDVAEQGRGFARELAQKQIWQREDLDDAHVEKGKAESVLAQLLKTEEDAGQLADEIEQNREALRLAELLVEAFSPGGTRQLMLDQALHELEAAANIALATLMPGFSVHSGTQSETGVETLEFMIRTPAGLLTWADLGGAASVAVALAVRIGLMDLLAKYRGVRYEHMILDEADSWLVGERQDGYVRLLQRLVESRGMTVTAISHITSVQETIGQQIVLTPSAEGTAVNLR
jgi:DNA repair exonuclease SbcCD ATPase subunit